MKIYPMRIIVTDREHATILAALRFWQSAYIGEGTADPQQIADGLDDIANGAGDFHRLDVEEVESLCQRINFPDTRRRTA